MDRKVTAGKTLAITDGKDDDFRGSTPFFMSPSDQKAVEETSSSARASKCQIAKKKEVFGHKGGFGLWWDAKGLFNSSVKEHVIDYMEKHRAFYEDVGKFTEMVNRGDTESYETLLDLYKKLSEMEEDAARDVKNDKSKAVCRMLREFFEEKYKVDHSLKRVECVVQRQVIHSVVQTVDRARISADRSREEIKDLVSENRKLKETMKQCMEMCVHQTKDVVERISKENDELKDDLERKMEKLIVDTRGETDKKIKEAIEEVSKRSDANMQEIMNMLKSMSGGSKP